MLKAYLLTLNRGATLLALLFAALFASTAQANEQRLSISGYDPVAYFTDGRPVQGKAEFEYVWRKLRWRFASAEHRDLFIKDPQRYSETTKSTSLDVSGPLYSNWGGDIFFRSLSPSNQTSGGTSR
jgi:hypothetical protein